MDNPNIRSQPTEAQAITPPEDPANNNTPQQVMPVPAATPQAQPVAAQQPITPGNNPQTNAIPQQTTQQPYAVNPQATNTTGLTENQVQWYRRYIPFAIIFIVVPFGVFAGC